MHEEFQRHVKFREILEDYASEDSLVNEKINNVEDDDDDDEDNNSILEELLLLPNLNEEKLIEDTTAMACVESNEEFHLENISCDSTLEICEEIEGLTINDNNKKDDLNDDKETTIINTTNNKLVKQETTIETSDFDDEQISVLENNKNIVNINLMPSVELQIDENNNVENETNELFIDLAFKNDKTLTKEKLINKKTFINKQNLNKKSNLRKCCNYKLITNTRLPNYNGYKSQYGLTKEQIHRRNFIFNYIYNKNINNFIKKQENYINKLIENENEFNKWLKKKIKNPVNKTKNMYDYNNNNKKKN